ncbi:MAG: nucleoside deaminase [Parvularculales bacterium]
MKHSTAPHILSLPEPMARALAEAQAAGLRGEVPVGAAVVDGQGNIIAAAGNNHHRLYDPTAHAEILALREAAHYLGCTRLDGCDLYVSLEPCAMCAGAISLARIRRLYYGAEDIKGGAVDNGPRFFEQTTCQHAPDVYGGIGAQEAAHLLRNFFAGLRDKSGVSRPDSPWQPQ